ncbi:MAG: transcription-repair coupling factor [Lactobacillaceae bacterium]|jgi:transcription-repair coupling factor (superfamily II helicase)|nr:transcription-repair coupling factor [Lactobacillaceae bacterium]
MQLTELFLDVPELAELGQALQAGGRHVITGVTGSARAVTYAALHQATKQPMILVSDSQFHADQLYEDISGILGDDHVALFPAEETIGAEVAVASLDIQLARVQALHLLLTDANAVIVTSFAGAKRYLPPVKDFKAAQITIDFDHEYDLQTLQRDLHKMGYQRTNAVDNPGEFAIRGSIVDVYPLNEENPVRMDFFDTELDTLRYFDAADQKSLAPIETLTILPATDLVADETTLANAKTQLEIAMTQARDALVGADKRYITEALTPLINALDQGGMLPEIRQYLHLLYPTPAKLYDYLPQAGIVIYDDYPRMLENAAQAELTSSEWWAEHLEHHGVLPDADFGVQIADLARDDKHTSVISSPMQRGIGNLRQTSLSNLVVRPSQQFFGQMPLLQSEVQRWQKQGMTIVFLTNTAERTTKLASELAEYKIPINETSAVNLTPKRTQLATLPLSAGFEVPALNLVVLTERELFQQVRKKAPKRQTLNNAERLKSYNELNPGDYVVHVNHGIGVYQGMETIEQRGIRQDYITIAYQKNAKIFIPVSQLDLVQKYVGAGEKAPKINKLGGIEWQKAKAKVAKRVEDIADELIQLYAERELKQGYAFGPDDDAIRTFEDAFPYPETPDQLRSAAEIKKDMEKARPMDRLLVGDVGFGKTEVAFRAAYKAIHEHKQVAMLVPTTILAQQHYDSMRARFENLGVRVAILSRFQTAKQAKQIVEKLMLHEIDMIVGTHRLLSKDIEFYDLGLLIIDEEQRFGVKHKERLKQLQINVDVLTLTATPIPRTLNMAMVGARDLSVIETPPANRYPIQTYVMEQNGQAIGAAIEREMARGGQTFYLHNRVEDIERVVGYVESLVPEARVGFIHGQMPEVQLEGILTDFINGEYDVLVTTTIIETGVDIPNANTLIVENADHMGLAQLYQLRGRVGRSHNVAYAYFMYPPTRSLTEESERRLAAIRDFTELGSGFKIAMRDLSIRGAGDLLGQQQHGFINAVGYDLYTEMLQAAVATKQGKQTAEHKTDAELDLQVEAYLPASYVADGPQKIDLYQRIRKANQPEQFAEIEADLVDRFGELPEAAQRLLVISQLKSLADAAGIAQIKQDFVKQNIIHVTFGVELAGADVEWLASLKPSGLRGQAIGVSPTKIDLVIQPKMTIDDWLPGVLDFVRGFVSEQ